jgi:hypothetical protein
MLARAVLLAVPSVAMAVVGFALFGPGAERSYNGAQIWGGPTEGTRLLSWRVLVLERFRGIDSTKNVGAIVVRARARDGFEVSTTCSTRADGTCDVALPLANEAHGDVHVDVSTRDDDVTLASGDFARGADRWDAGRPHPPELAGAAAGDLRLEVTARRGVFAAPFRDSLIVTVLRGDSPIRDARVTLRSDGADLDGETSPDTGATLRTTERGEATFTLAPRSHTVDVSIEASSPGLTGTWAGILPVIPGAMWLDPGSLAAHRIRILSPVIRSVAFATLSTRRARLWGGIISLSPDEKGFEAGQIDWPSLDVSAPLWLTLSSDPRASGAGTVGWPVTPEAVAQGELAFHDWLLLDGMPAAERRDTERRGRARRLSATALGAAAVIEGILLARGSYRKSAGWWIWLLVAIATVALAFAALGLVASWKIG